MTDAPGTASKVRGALRIARYDHAPAVDEDLGADLLGDRRAVEFNRAAHWRRDATLQPQIGRVLSGVADATPPEDRSSLDEVVEPGVADLLRGQVGIISVVRERSQKGEGPRDVVVSDDQRHSPRLVDVAVDFAVRGGDAIVGPAL